MEPKPKFDYCTICGKKIGWLRKWRMKRLDEDPIHLIPLSQFCSNKCAGVALDRLLEEVDKQE